MARVVNKKVTTARKPLQSIKNKNTLVPIKDKNPGRASAGQVAKNKATRAKQTTVRANNAYSKKATAADARRIWNYNDKNT
jgi:hypothetical protein